MKKKQKKIPEQTTKKSGPIQIRKDSLVLAMRRLIANEDFQLLRSLWLGKRGAILETGKSKPTEAQWSRLAGFDDAIMLPEEWATMETRDDQNQQRADNLQASLAGT